MADSSDAQDKPLATTFIVCGVVLQKDDKYLLVQERQPKAYGKWNLPAGKVDEGETLEQAAVREAKEETGFGIKLGRHLMTLHATTESPVLHAFVADITGGELDFPEHEIMDAQWFTYDEVLAMKDELRNARYIVSAIEATRV